LKRTRSKNWRPEPIFKLLTRLEAAQFGIQAIEAELQYTTRADLGMTLPATETLVGQVQYSKYDRFIA